MVTDVVMCTHHAIVICAHRAVGDVCARRAVGDVCSSNYW